MIDALSKDSKAVMLNPYNLETRGVETYCRGPARRLATSSFSKGCGLKSILPNLLSQNGEIVLDQQTGILNVKWLAFRSLQSLGDHWIRPQVGIVQKADERLLGVFKHRFEILRDCNHDLFLLFLKRCQGRRRHSNSLITIPIQLQLSVKEN